MIPYVNLDTQIGEHLRAGQVAALSFVLLELLPVNFLYWQFAVVLLLNDIGMGPA